MTKELEKKIVKEELEQLKQLHEVIEIRKLLEAYANKTIKKDYKLVYREDLELRKIEALINDIIYKHLELKYRRVKK